MRLDTVSQPIDFEPYFRSLVRSKALLAGGVVTQVVGLLIESKGPAAAIGDFCEIRTAAERPIRVQVIGFRNGHVLSMPLEETGGLQLGNRIVARSDDARVRVGPALLGRVLDGFGRPIDGRGPVIAEANYELNATPPGPLERENIEQRLTTGIRAIDSLLPCGKGQRIGIFGGSGVGKSTLLGAMARHSSADVNVIALIGERNREVREFLEKELSPEGLARSVVIVATSDRPAPLRIRAAFVALAVSEYFRDQGKDVLLVMDSVTRLAMAQREIGLAAGEPPSQKGYTPSVFALLPKVFERSGNFPRGSITGFFTVLVEGDDFNEPICDAVRAILDGHIQLSRALGTRGHYPAIDILHSVSRLASRIATSGERTASQRIREALAILERSEDLINLGAYVSGANPELDAALRLSSDIDHFLMQDAEASAPLETTLDELNQLAAAMPAQ
ncbi:MAG TPA: FliI/YscN family ATPase [Bryobacteraceae bacterium]|nr:FliI/YscN family ATPase [Bryobacteraceae bacterium]